MKFTVLIQLFLLIILPLVGVAQLVFGNGLYGHFFFLSAFSLLSILSERFKHLLWFVIVAVVTHIIEVIGVATGLVFGSYEYSSLLGPAIGGVPVIIGIQWALIVLGLHSIVFNFLKGRKKKFARAAVVGLLAVGFDIVLEIVAIRMNFWQWSVGYVPIHNYIAWFCIAFLSSLFLSKKSTRGVEIGVVILFCLLVVFSVIG